MESITVREVDRLPSDQRRSLEALLKHPLEEGQQVFIMAFRTGVAPDEATRRNAHADMHKILDEAHAHARAHGVTSEEADSAVEEAMDHVRRRPP